VLGLSGATIGYIGGSLLASALTKKPNVEGPRLGDLRVTGTEYGSTIPWVAGGPRISGQIAWASDRREIANTQKVGKGGGGKVTNFTYEVDLLILLSENEIEGVSRIWLNGEMVYNGIAKEGVWSALTIYKGGGGQLPDPTYEAAVGLGNAPAYRGRGYVVIQGLQLGGGGQIPNLTFEVGFSSASPPITEIFRADFEGNANDSATNPVTGTVSGVGTISYIGSPGSQELNLAAVGGQSGLSAIWAAPKLNASLYSGERTEVSFFASFNRFDGTNYLGDHQQFCVYGGGVANSTSFVRQSANGSEHLFAGGSNLGVVFPLQFLGDLPTGKNKYAFRFSADGTTTEWLVNDVVVHSRMTGRVSFGNLVLVMAAPAFTGVDKILDITFDTARMTTTGSGSSFFDPSVSVLSDVIGDLCSRAGYAPEDFDTTPIASITKPVRGMALGQVAATRGALETLQTAYFFEPSKSDKIYLRPRSTVPVASIPYDDLGAAENAASDAEPLELTVGSELEMPSQISLSYNNTAADYNVSTEQSDRLLSSQVSTQVVQLGLGMLPAEAKGVADGLLVDQLASLTRTTLRLPLKYAYIEPGDVFNVTNADGRVYRFRSTSKTDTLTTIEHQCVLDDAGALISAGITSTEYTSTNTVAQIAPNTLVLMDIPLLRDEDNSPGHYVAASGGTGVLTLFESDDGVAYAPSTSLSSGATIGTASTILPAWAGGNIFDEASTLTVAFSSGQLASVTRGELLSTTPVNALLVGAEIVQFRNAALVGAGVYALSGFLRGLRDTATTGHVAGERVVLLSGGGVRFIQMQASELNQPRFYKAASGGQTLSAIPAQPMTPRGVVLVPFRPYNVRSQPVAEGTLYTWNRKTRLSENWLTGLVPLDEPVEAYRLDIYDGATLKRSLLSSVESVIYTGADQFADFGVAAASVRVEVYQLKVSVSSPGASAPVEPVDPGAPVAPVVVLPPAAGASRVTIEPVVVAGSTLIVQRASVYGSNTVYQTFESANGGVTFSPIAGTSALVSNSPPATAALASGTYVSFDDVGIAQKFSQQDFYLVVGSPGAAAAVSSAKFSRPHLPVAVASDGTKFAFMTQGNKVFTSTNGVTLTDRGVSSGLPFNYTQSGSRASNYGQAVPFVYQSGRWFILAPGQELYYTTDANATTGWTKCNMPSPSGGLTFRPNFYRMAAIGSSLFITGAASVGSLNINVIMKSSDTGSNWDISLNPAEGAITDVFNLAGRLVSVSYDWVGTTNVSDDSGATWSSISNGLSFVDRVYPQIVGGRLIIARLLPPVPGQSVHQLMHTTDGVNFTASGGL
jgi:hypothetical protein